MLKDIKLAKLPELANKYGGAEKLVEKLIKVGEFKAKKKMIPVLLGVALASSALTAGVTLLLAEQALKNREKSKALKETVKNAAEKVIEPEEAEDASPEEPIPADKETADEAAAANNEKE